MKQEKKNYSSIELVGDKEELWEASRALARDRQSNPGGGEPLQRFHACTSTLGKGDGSRIIQVD